ncbi:CotH kinase family protein [Asaia sp. HN010]|uniref:CotH kinase family protein n=1 Tax=Asaia sp. HN010 TaxID=3081233 RepID=UPI003019AC33
MAGQIDSALWALNAGQTSLPIRAAKGPLRFIATGKALPVVGTDQAVSLVIMDGLSRLAEAGPKTTMGVQGQSSAGATKKNWKFKLRNHAGKKLGVTYGSWPESTSITLKAYGSFADGSMALDRSMIREAVAAELWRQIRRNSSDGDNRIAPWYAWSAGAAAQSASLLSEALFSTDSTPVELYWTDGSTDPQFLGLYMWRSNNDPDSYLMTPDHQSHCLLQPQHAPPDLWSRPDYLSGQFWEFMSPDAPDPSVPARLIEWFAAILDGRASWQDWPDYLNLRSWIDYKVFSEAVGSFDSLSNNIILGSWTATASTGLWDVFVYDLDETLGCVWGYNGNADPADIGLITAQSTLWTAFSEHFADRIAARWRELRRAGVLSGANLTAIMTRYAASMRPGAVLADQAAWGTNSISSHAYIATWFEQRVRWLDQQWGGAD